MALALLAGWSLLRPVGRNALSPTALALELVFGTTLLVGIGFPLARLGVPVTPGTIAGLAAFLALGLLLLGRRRTPLVLDLAAPSDGISKLAGFLIFAGLGLFLLKLAFAPLWSWDHFTVWGVKSRRMLVDGVLDLGFLDLRSFRGSEAHYPLGLPFAWRLLGLGARPGELAFKVCHGLFGLALVAVTRHGLLLASGSRRTANALAAWFAVSPIFWDTIGVGHADLFLALWAATALALVFQGIEAPGAGTAPLALAGIAAGFLPWLKQEGLLDSLALLATAALLLWRSTRPDRRRRLLALGLPAAVTLAASRLASDVAHVHGVNFFAGRWWVRAAVRVPHTSEILRAAAAELFAADWLGIWIVFFLACLFVAFRPERRRGTAAILCGLILALFAVYVAVYFVTVLRPIEHLHSSLFRIAGPLVPPALYAMASLLREEAADRAAPSGR